MSDTHDKAKGIAYDIALIACKEFHQHCDSAEALIPIIAAALEAERKVGYEQGEQENKTADAYFERLKQKAEAVGYRQGIEAGRDEQKDKCKLEQHDICEKEYRRGIEAAAKMAEFHSGPSSQLAERIRGLVK